MAVKSEDVAELLAETVGGRRLSPEQGARLFECDDLTQLGEAAHCVRLRKTRPDVVTYNVDRNINYTNICVCGCRFCAFHRDAAHPQAYVLSHEEIGRKVAEMIELGGRQVLLQGGLHPALRLEWHEGLLRFLKKRYGIHNHAYSAPEIIHLAGLENLSITEVLGRLKDAGLDSIPGGGAEILSDRVRAEISPAKCSADEWIAVHRAAHGMGLRTTATMMLGHVETFAERVEHFERVRRLQEETGGFTAFISWTFQPMNTALFKGATNGDGPSGPWRIGSHDYLKTLAISRLYLDNIDHFQASWVTQGEAIGQLALMFGCDDLGSTMIEENVVRSAGVTFHLSEERLRQLIEEIGLRPQRRDFYYGDI